MNKILVIIPYFAGGAQGNELEYAIAGWFKHFKEDFILVVVGDHHPAVEKYGPNVKFIGCERVEPIEGEYRPALDIINKMLLVREHFPDSKNFVWSNDDIYAVNDFHLSDIQMLKCLGGEIPGDPDSVNGWIVSGWRTKQLLLKEGKSVRNFALHLPSFYEWDKVLALIDKYDIRHHSYVFNILYFNTYFADEVPFQLDAEHDNIKLGIYSSDVPQEVIEKAFDTKIWINNSVRGYNANLRNMLYRHYNE